MIALYLLELQTNIKYAGGAILLICVVLFIFIPMIVDIAEVERKHYPLILTWYIILVIIGGLMVTLTVSEETAKIMMDEIILEMNSSR